MFWSIGIVTVVPENTSPRSAELLPVGPSASGPKKPADFVAVNALFGFINCDWQIPVGSWKIPKSNMRYIV